jgi:hypothetical protein
MKNYFLIALLPLILLACYDSAEQEKAKNMKCDSFIYESGVVIKSKFRPDTICKIIVYKKTLKENPSDTLLLIINDHSNYKDEYSISRPNLNTAYDYKFIINDSLVYTLSEIKSKLFGYGGDFMSGTHYMCQLTSYKLNDSLIKDDKNITITLP